MPRKPLIECPPGKLDQLKALMLEKRELESQAVIAGLAYRPWQKLARPKQLPPHNPAHHLADENGITCGCNQVDKDYETWLFCAGRGTGKTLAGANNLVTDALTGCTVHPGKTCHQCPHTFAVVAPTRDHLKQVCFEGDSGILSALEDGEHTQYNKSLLMVTLKNGNLIRGFSAENEERYRGPNLSGVWVDELGVFRHEGVWHQMRLALRIGRTPRIYVTTTPRPTRLIRQLFQDAKEGKVHVTTGSTRENEANLSATMLESLYGRYGGTRLGRQELEGNLLEDIPGSLWKREWFDRDRVDNPPEDLTRVVVAMDPAVTTGEDSDETGIIVAAQAADGHAYVLADLTRRETPYNCCKRAIDAYYEFKADAVVGEQNNGGDYIRDLIHSVDPNVTYRQVYATRGKATRAQPVSSLYEQGRVHHAGLFPELEDQLSTWLPDDLDSPDRLDALVWGVHFLRDMFTGGWTDLYGTVRCETCGQMVLRLDRTHCPKCDAPLPAKTSS
jgi:phage terminase large subunit-like protein